MPCKATRERRSALIRAFKAAKGCARCDESDPVALDLHHRDPDEKNPRLRYKSPKGWRSSNWVNLPEVELLAELEKCEVLCANCHRKVEHYGSVSAHESNRNTRRS